MPKHGAHTTLPASPTTPGNYNLDNLKCFECGKNGHFQSQCPNNLKCVECGKNEHLQNQCPNNLKCFECGKNGHFQNQCPNNKLFAPTQAFVVLSTGATTNLEDGNTPKFEASTSLPTPLSNRYRDNVKCFKCGKNGHFHNQCSERKSDNVKCFECGKGGHYQNQCSERKRNDVKCFDCGKSGHYQRQCPKRKRPSPMQAYETLLTVATTNLEGGNMSKHGAPTTSLALPMSPDNHNLDNLKYCEWGKNEHFQNQCSDNKVFAPTQVDAVLPTIATTNLEVLCQTGISDQKKSIETPYCSTQDTCGKYVSILDKSTFEDKHYEEFRREDFHHGNKGCDQEQVQAWGQIQSSPFGLTNIASSFDQSPKTDTPQLPVVVTSENNKGSGDTPYIATKTSVWWDIENCPVPRGNSDTYYLAQNISSALADAGYKGAVTISAYGDTHKIPNAVQQALSSTGIALNHVPAVAILQKTKEMYVHRRGACFALFIKGRILIIVIGYGFNNYNKGIIDI